MLSKMLAVAALGLIATGLASAPASAAPITYSMEFLGSGSFGGTNFSSADVLLKFVGDTDSVFICATCSPTNYYMNTNGVTTATVAGIGTGTFTRTAGVFSLQPTDPSINDPAAGFLGDTIIGGQVWTKVFVAYFFDDAGVLDGALDLGPNGTLGNFGNGTTWETTAGDLILSTTTATNKFTAVLGESTQVPEPGTLMLFGAGAAALGLRRRGKSKARIS